MNTFEEQKNIIETVYKNNTDENIYNDFMYNRNLKDWQKRRNKGLLIRVFKKYLTHSVNNDEIYKDMLKLYIKLFIQNNTYITKYYNVIQRYYYIEHTHNLETICNKYVYNDIVDKNTNEIILTIKFITKEDNSDDKTIIVTRFLTETSLILLVPNTDIFDKKFDIYCRHEFIDFNDINYELDNIKDDKLMNRDEDVCDKCKTLIELIKNDDINKFTIFYNTNDINVLLANLCRCSKCESIFELIISFNAIKCFKFLISSGVNIDPAKYPKNLTKLLAISDNYEIFHILEQTNELLFMNEKFYYELFEMLIDYHNNELAKYYYNKSAYIPGSYKKLFIQSCLKYYNYDLMIYLIENGYTDINKISTLTEYSKNEYKYSLVALEYIKINYNISPFTLNTLYMSVATREDYPIEEMRRLSKNIRFSHKIDSLTESIRNMLINNKPTKFIENVNNEILFGDKRIPIKVLKHVDKECGKNLFEFIMSYYYRKKIEVDFKKIRTLLLYDDALYDSDLLCYLTNLYDRYRDEKLYKFIQFCFKKLQKMTITERKTQMDKLMEQK